MRKEASPANGEPAWFWGSKGIRSGAAVAVTARSRSTAGNARSLGAQPKRLLGATLRALFHADKSPLKKALRCSRKNVIGRRARGAEAGRSRQTASLQRVQLQYPPPFIHLPYFSDEPPGGALNEKVELLAWLHAWLCGFSCACRARCLL